MLWYFFFFCLNSVRFSVFGSQRPKKTSADEFTELASLRGDMMADYKHNRRSFTEDGGDICAGLTTNIMVKKWAVFPLSAICWISIKTDPFKLLSEETLVKLNLANSMLAM